MNLEKDVSRHAANCRWAEPTLLLNRPWWFEASTSPWACVRHGTPMPLPDTDACAECRDWEPRREEPRA